MDKGSSFNEDIPIWLYEAPIKKPLKNSEVQSLKDYSAPAPDSFWETFLVNRDLDGSKTNLDTNALEEALKNSADFLTEAEILRGEKSIKFLREKEALHIRKHHFRVAL